MQTTQNSLKPESYMYFKFVNENTDIQEKTFIVSNAKNITRQNKV